MGKGFRGKPCAYCGDQGETADHIFARRFFPVAHRANLPKVAACVGCNAEKSRLEHYVLSVLPFGGHHPGATALLASEVPRRLAKNRKLHLKLAQGREGILVRRGGTVHSTFALPFDSTKLAGLFSMIARGLAHHAWGVLIPRDYFVGAGFLSREGEALFEGLMRKRSRAEARGNLGAGLVLYQGVQAIDDPCLTLWRFQLYGGIVFSGDPDLPNEAPSNIWASTSRKRVPGFPPNDWVR
jgi:hypothetical protein